MASTIKVNNIQNQCGANIINESANTITIGASGDTIQLAAGASQTGFGRTGTVDWDTTAKTTGFTAVSGTGYFCNTSGGAFTATLPASPSAGDIVSFSDYTRTFATNNLTIGRNSQPIGGIAQDAILSTEGQAATFVYVDGTEGWINVQETSNSVTGTNPFIVATGGTITTCGNCKIHTFTSPGTFTVCKIAEVCAPTRNQVSYLVVAGGGGGAGGFRENKAPLTPYTASPLNGSSPITVTATAFPITVGAGGAKSPMPITDNASPGTSSIFSIITSAGGGGGGSGYLPPPIRGAGSGGSGGGGSSGGGASDGSGGSGNTPPVSPPQGQNGGNGSTNPGQGGDGGGGATAVGGAGGGPSPPSPNSPGGAGGNGATTGISGSATAYAGGGGGGDGSPPTGPNAVPGGTGGGGTGGGNPGPAGQPGTINTGGGAGGGAAAGGPNHCGGNGGSGIVIIRYKYQ